MVALLCFGKFCCHGLGPLVALRERKSLLYKIILTAHLQPRMTYLSLDGSGLFQNDPAHMHREQGLTEWFKEEEPPDINLIEHLLESLVAHVRHRSPSASSKHNLKEYLSEEWHVSLPEIC